MLAYDASRDSADQIEDLYIGNRLISYQNALEVLFTKVLEIFEYEGLPETLPKRVLEGYLTRNGFAVVYEVDGETFVSDQKPSGKPDLYGNEREVTIEHFDQRITRTVGVDAVYVRNDSNCLGLENLLTEFALLTSQAKISMLNSLIMLRTNYVLQAKDENSAQSALEFEAQVRAGKSSVLLAEEFAQFEGMTMHNTPVQGQQVTQVIDLVNYINSYYWSELGVSLNGNFKSQYQNKDELQKSTGMPLVFNMLAERMESVRDINALFDKEIKVCLSSEWSEEIEDEEIEDDIPENEVEAPEEAPSGEAPAETPAVEAPAGGADHSESEEEEFGDTPDEVTADELVEATEILIDEEVTADDEADEPDASGSDEDRSDSDEDEVERTRVESEEDDDEK